MSRTQLADRLFSTMTFDKERSRLEIGGAEVSFHCDKFNTRILKNFEDVMGYEEGGRLLSACAESTTYDSLQRFLGEGEAGVAFQALGLAERLEAIFEMFKVLAYGAIAVQTATPESARFTSASSYLAEGWLENQARWHLDEREGPACHDICGHIAAAMAVATGKPAGSYRVKETRCRAYKGATECEFLAEAK